MSSRLNSRMVRLEAKHGVRDCEGIDLNTLTDAELCHRIYWLCPDRAERWPGWPHMTHDERWAIVTDKHLFEIIGQQLSAEELGT